MINATVYDKKTGNIKRILFVQDIEQNIFDGEAYIYGTHQASKKYIIEGTVTDKPAIPVTIDKLTINANGVDVATISGIPVGCACEVGGQAGVVNDGMLELTFDNPGQYTLNLTVFPYLDYSVVINAT